MIYKIIYKVIANNLKPIFLSLISSEQSGFVEGRQISNGIILIHEILHSIKLNKMPSMLVKLDIAKAYDKLNWQFIRRMLVAFGFGKAWVNWIMNLISLVIFSILMNGVPSNIITPMQGIYQGDPLSPFVFILMAEGLGRSIAAAKEANSKKGICGSLGGARHSHQQFVDDTMLMGYP